MRVAREAAGQHLRQEPERQQEPVAAVLPERQEQPVQLVQLERQMEPVPQKQPEKELPEPPEGQASELGQEPQQELQAGKEPERPSPSFRKGS